MPMPTTYKLRPYTQSEEWLNNSRIKRPRHDTTTDCHQALMAWGSTPAGVGPPGSRVRSVVIVPADVR